ncbi:MAG: hypothetical protein J7621_12605 [Niastella sp.]|nr:hypothetical protein [Niastella sp.]
MNRTPGIVFEDLLVALKMEGFVLSVNDYIEFTAVFNQFKVDRDTLKYYLAPIVCCNREEQEKFYAIYDHVYSSSETPIAEREKLIRKSVYGTINAVVKSYALSYRIFFVLLLLSIIASAISYWLIGRTNRNSIVNHYSSIDTTMKPLISRAGLNKLYVDKPVHLQIDTSVLRKKKLTDVKAWFFWSVEARSGRMSGSAITTTWQEPGSYKVKMDVVTEVNGKPRILASDSTVLAILPPPVQVAMNKERYALGDTVRLSARHLLDGYSPKDFFWEVINDRDSATIKYVNDSSFVASKYGSYAVALYYKDRKWLCARLIMSVEAKVAASQVLTAGPLVEKENDVHPTAIGWLMLIGIGLLAISTSLFAQKKSKFLPEIDSDTTKGEELPMQVPFTPKDHFIQKLPVQTALAETLIRPIDTGAYNLDVKKTVLNTVRLHGLLSPVYNSIQRKPEYLVLIDAGNVFLFNLFRHFVKTLQSDTVRINYYFYYGPNAFYTEDGRRVAKLYDLRERHSNARLIIMGDGYNFIDYRKGDLKDNLSAELAAWPDRVLITPVPSMDWLGNESVLKKDFELVAADSVNLRRLIQLFSNNEEGSGASYFRSQDVYESKYLDLTTIKELQEYLNDDDLLQWVCALAVYPSVKWQVMLAVGHALLSSRKAAHKLNYSTLLKIGRINWLREEGIPADIRLMLLKELSLDDEIKAREAILHLLNETDPLIDNKRFAFEEKMVQVYTQSFVLYANNLHKYKQYENEARMFMSLWDKKKILDQVTVIYLKNENKQWETPLRSINNQNKPIAPNKLLNELLSLHVIHNPVIRRWLRRTGVACLLLLLSLFPLKDSLYGWQINKTIGFIKSAYQNNSITVSIPVNDCLKDLVSSNNGKLPVTLVNYDNNKYKRMLDDGIKGQDTVRVVFDNITMSDKSEDDPTFYLIIGEREVYCQEKSFYRNYNLVLQGEDCKP